MISETIIAALLLSTQIIFISAEISLTDSAQSNFAVNLLQKIAEDGKSTILSPLSVSTSLFMVYLAADGETKQQLHNVMGGTISVSGLQAYFYRILADIAPATNDNYTLNIANRLCIRDRFRNLPENDSVYFNETLNKFNLGSKDEFVQEIKDWISSMTNNKIRNMITADNINSDTLILLINVIYFKGTWEKQFMEEETLLKQFYISVKETKMIPMMYKIDEVSYYEDDLLKLIRMPYIGNEVEMVVILPQTRFGLSNVLEILTGDKLLNYIGSAQKSPVSISLPKFRVERKLNLNNVLQQIGITDIFSSEADFPELLEDPAQIFVNDVMHAGFIQVDEKGTESAAATVIGIEVLSAVPYNFIADQPFLFAITKNMKTVLFVGQFIE